MRRIPGRRYQIRVMIVAPHRIRSLFRLSGIERRLFLEAAVLHFWVGLLLKVIPFRWIPRLFANPQSVVSHQLAVIELISTATVKASKISPWKNRCLVSSLASRCMLRRRKIESKLILGVAKDERGKLEAHAGLEAGGSEIVPMGRNFQQLFQF